MWWCHNGQLDQLPCNRGLQQYHIQVAQDMQQICSTCHIRKTCWTMTAANTEHVSIGTCGMHLHASVAQICSSSDREACNLSNSALSCSYWFILKGSCISFRSVTPWPLMPLRILDENPSFICTGNIIQRHISSIGMLPLSGHTMSTCQGLVYRPCHLLWDSQNDRQWPVAMILWTEPVVICDDIYRCTESLIFRQGQRAPIVWRAMRVATYSHMQASQDWSEHLWHCAVAKIS